MFAVLISSLYACGKQHDEAARRTAIEAALKPLGQIDIPTGSRLNIGPNAMPMFRRLEAAGLIRITAPTQGYWDNFASRTFMEGARPFRVQPTQDLNAIAVNPKWKPSRSVALSQETLARTLEDSWNFYVRREIFLGPTCFGGDISIPNSDGFCVHELNDDYPRYSALASNGLIELTELDPSTVPPPTVQYLPRIAVKRVARVRLTPKGERLATVDPKNGTAKFVFGTYKLQQVTKNQPIASSQGAYRLVEGTHIFDLRPEFKNVWQQAGYPMYRERRFRAVFYYNEKYPLSEGETPTPQQLEFIAKCTKCAPKWQVATASNRRYTAEDVGPRDGEFESANVPPTAADLPERGNTADDSYTWHVSLADLRVVEILRDEDYKGPLATPGETFRLVLGKIEHRPLERRPSIPSDLLNTLPGRLRCILKYSDFDKTWKVVALDLAPTNSEKWLSDNVR